MSHIIDNPHFWPSFIGALLVLGMGWALYFAAKDLVRDFIHEGKQRVEKYEAREMRRKMNQPTRKH